MPRLPERGLLGSPCRTDDCFNTAERYPSRIASRYTGKLNSYELNFCSNCHANIEELPQEVLSTYVLYANRYQHFPMVSYNLGDWSLTFISPMGGELQLVWGPEVEPDQFALFYFTWDATGGVQTDDELGSTDYGWMGAAMMHSAMTHHLFEARRIAADQDQPF